MTRQHLFPFMLVICLAVTAIGTGRSSSIACP